MITKGDDLSGAIFSDDARYRYRLWRVWKPEQPRCCFIMLNPSTADEIENDPTIERCARRVRAWSVVDREARPFLSFWGGVEVVNIFALRSTDPKALYKTDDPIGPENDASIRAAVHTAIDSDGIVILAWGAHGNHRKRGVNVMSLLQDIGAAANRCMAFTFTANGNPGHPLYLGYNADPRSVDLATASFMPDVVDA